MSNLNCLPMGNNCPLWMFERFKPEPADLFPVDEEMQPTMCCQINCTLWYNCLAASWGWVGNEQVKLNVLKQVMDGKSH